MLNENLKIRRTQKGFSQEELAIKLNVVRQTISKWEKGLSVPDSEMLVKIADVLECSVSEMLGETVTAEKKQEELRNIAVKLELLNEQFAKQAEHRRKLWHGLCIAAAIIAAGILLNELFPYLHLLLIEKKLEDTLAFIGGSDGPTAIFVADGGLKNLLPTILAAVAAILSVMGIFHTRRRK